MERFTDRARSALHLAQEETRLLNHDYIGTEHLLLGLIHEGEGIAAKALVMARRSVRGGMPAIADPGSSPLGSMNGRCVVPARP
jgi:ATP-dependent Clp protease ATP-binding subunit ClpC